MWTLILTLALVLNLGTAGCARAASSSRKAYILAKDHGWIELTVADDDIPATLPDEEDEDLSPRAPLCQISVQINNEPFMSDYIYPSGELPPYIAETGFRFPAQEGEIHLRLKYSGCDIQDENETNVVTDAVVIVRKGFVTPVTFDGTSLYVETLREDDVLTLEDVDNRLQKIEHLLQAR